MPWLGLGSSQTTVLSNRVPGALSSWSSPEYIPASPYYCSLATTRADTSPPAARRRPLAPSDQRLAPSGVLCPAVIQACSSGCARPRKGLHASARVLDRAWAHPPPALYSATGSVSLPLPSSLAFLSQAHLHSSARHPVSHRFTLCPPVSHRPPHAIFPTLVAVSVLPRTLLSLPTICVITASHHISPFYPGQRPAQPCRPVSDGLFER